MQGLDGIRIEFGRWFCCCVEDVLVWSYCSALLQAFDRSLGTEPRTRNYATAILLVDQTMHDAIIHRLNTPQFPEFRMPEVVLDLVRQQHKDNPNLQHSLKSQTKAPKPPGLNTRIAVLHPPSPEASQTSQGFGFSARE